MDDLDLAMMRFFAAPGNLRWDVRASFAEAARAVGATEDTLRKRFQALQDRGALRRWDVFVAPGLMGMEFGRIELDAAPERQADLVERVRLVDGVRLVFEYLDGGIAVVAYVDGQAGLERTARLLGALADAPWRTALLDAPPIAMDPTPADWRLLQALREDPRAPYGRIADALGVSERTVRRRHQRLIEGRAAFLSIDIDFTRIEGRFTTEGRVWFDTPDTAARLRALGGAWDDVIFVGTGTDAGVVSRLARTPIEVSETRSALADLDGVRETRVDIVQRRIVLDEWLDAEVARRIEG